MPPNDSFASLNDITEYSDSLGTASNTNTASSIARSINDNNMNGPMNMFPNHQQNYNQLLNDVNNNSQHLKLFGVHHNQNKTTKGQTNQIKPKTTFNKTTTSSKTQIQLITK